MSQNISIREILDSLNELFNERKFYSIHTYGRTPKEEKMAKKHIKEIMRLLEDEDE